MITMFLLEKNKMHVVTQATVQRVVVLGFQNGLHDSRISTNVFPQAPVIVAVDRPD